jgi:parallel beta-helix repeat protein/predicted outer membrane repeat protein
VGTLTITNSTLSSNSSFDSGGGILATNGNLAITNSTLSGNSATNYGGGIFTGGSSNLTVTNSTLSGNNVNSEGGGIYNYTGTMNIYNSSIVFNGADMDQNGGQAGGVFNDDANGATTNLRNTLVAGNYVANSPQYQDCVGTLNSYGRNLIGALLVVDLGGCAVNLISGSWNHLNDLNLVGPLQNNGGPTWTHALLPGSNAIDGGDAGQGCIGSNSLPLATDQRGFARVVGVRCDIGAYELGSGVHNLFLPLILR